MQRQGIYPPPPGASPILGLECAGEVAELGAGVTGWRVGDRAMALLAGGGYAEEVVVHAGSLLPVPASFSWEQAASLPEVYLTVFLTVFQLGGLREGAVSCTAAAADPHRAQLAKHAGARVVATAGSTRSASAALEPGADAAVNYRTGDFPCGGGAGDRGRGVTSLDSIGAPYLERNLAALAVGGRLVLIGLMGGAKANNPAALLARRFR